MNIPPQLYIKTQAKVINSEIEQNFSWSTMERPDLEIKDYFKKILGRELDETNLQYFVNLIKDGKMTIQDIKNSIFNSPEALFQKTKKFLRYAPKFKSVLSDNETNELINSVQSWYHTFDFGNISIPNPRTTLDYQMWIAQGIPLDLKGKKVLDIGAADGFYSFLCESRGAERVVAADFLQFDGFQAAKKILNSKVEHRKIDVNSIDTLDETFDIVLFFGVYYHLENPVLALQKIFSKANDTAFLAGHIIDNPEPIMCYYDEYEMHPNDRSNWWVASPSCIERIARRIGFKNSNMLDSLDFDNSYQIDSIKNSIRNVRKVGVFKLSK